MFKWCALFLMVAVAGGAQTVAPADLPPSARGTFVQRKTLADIDVTLTSTGTFRFERDRFFAFDIEKPVASSFVATPTNYTFTVNGKSETRALDVNVSSFESLFAIKEMKAFVKEVKVEPERAFPSRVRVVFKNGDRLEIDLARSVP